MDAEPGRRSQLDDSGASRAFARLEAERDAPEAAALREAGAAGEASGGTPLSAAGGASNARELMNRGT